ncbi:MAG: multidrug efflux pump subunit AcrB [Rhodoferax sp.]|jgi:multidrug efflux pump subunit AcrB
MTVTQKPGENAVNVAQAVRARMAALGVIPAHIEATITRDYGAMAAEKANKLIHKRTFTTGSVIFWWTLRLTGCRRLR